MGIANTTPASALYAFLLGLTPEDAVGPGTGAGPEMIAHKAEIIRKAFRPTRPLWPGVSPTADLIPLPL